MANTMIYESKDSKPLSTYQQHKTGLKNLNSQSIAALLSIIHSFVFFFKSESFQPLPSTLLASLQENYTHNSR